MGQPSLTEAKDQQGAVHSGHYMVEVKASHGFPQIELSYKGSKLLNFFAFVHVTTTTSNVLFVMDGYTAL